MRRITAEMSQWQLQRCTGKNLFNKKLATIGMDISIASGSTYTNAERFISDFIPITPNTAYIMTWQTVKYGCFYGANKKFLGSGAYFAASAFTTPNGCYYVRFGALLSEIDTIQLELGLERTPYEPYCGGSPNLIEIDNCKGGYFSTLPDYGLRVEGATLQDGTPTPDNPIPIRCVKAGTVVRAGSPMTTATAWINTSNQLAYSSDSFAVRLPIKPSTKYELYLDTAVSSLFRAGVTYSATLPVTGEPITLSPCVRDNAPNHITLTTGSGAKYIWIQIAKSQMQAIYSLTVIDKGTGMSYKPFAVSEVIVPCDLYEGDVWYPMTGRVERVNGMNVYDGSSDEVWSKSASVPGGAWIIPTPNMKRNINEYAVCGRCDYLHYDRNGYFDNVGGCYYCDSSLIVCLGDEHTTLSSIRSHLNQNPITFVYPLATPRVEHYDPQPIFAPQGTVIVTQSPTELAANLSATMLVRR